MANYQYTDLRQQLVQLGKCRFMGRDSPMARVTSGKKYHRRLWQGLNQGLNMRDSGLDISTACKGYAGSILA